MGNKELDFFTKAMQSSFARAQNGTIVLTNFLDEESQSLILAMKPKDIYLFLDGGFINAEHKRCFLSSMELRPNFKIKVYKIEYNPRYLQITHRKLLGALMGLGIKRECIGDILIKENRVYFACTEEISAYILASFKTISGIPIELVEENEGLEIKKEIREETHIVSSMRLDVIIASAYKLSRTEATTMIVDGNVQINHKVCLSTSKIVSENDIISVHHKGRIYVGMQGGKTKSGRLVLKLGFLV